jgi:hypothetical protein
VGKDDEKTPKTSTSKDRPVKTIVPNKTVKVREGQEPGATQDKRL